MNEEKFERKVIKKYGVPSKEIKDLPVSKIRNLKINNKIALKENEKLKLTPQNEKFKSIKQGFKVISKGALAGTSVSGTINTLFPGLVPVIGTYFTASNKELNLWEKIGISFGLASSAVDKISGPVVILVGASLGAVLYSGYTLVKKATSNLRILNDKQKAKKINR